MVTSKTEITLELTPQARVDVINVSERITEQFGDILSRFQKPFITPTIPRLATSTRAFAGG